MKHVMVLRIRFKTYKKPDENPAKLAWISKISKKKIRQPKVQDFI